MAPKDANQIGFDAVVSELKQVATILGNIQGTLSGNASSASPDAKVSTPPKTNVSLGLPGMTNLSGQALGGMANWADKRINAATGGSTPPVIDKMRSAGNFLQTAGTSYMPQGIAVAQSVAGSSRKIGAMSSDLIGTGGQSGYNVTGGDIGIGPFGMRTPFSAAGAVGLDQRMQAFGTSMGAGITYSGARNIQQSLQDRGYIPPTGPLGKAFGVESRDLTGNYNRMNDAVVNLAKTSPLGEKFATDPATIDSLDRSTRMGASGIKQWLDTMKQMPNAMQAAQVSARQLMTDMNSWGEWSQKNGSTYAHGMKTSQEMSNITGMPGAVTQSAMGGGFVRANLMRNTGLMPWQLAQASAGQNIQALYGTLGQLDKSIGMTPETRTTNARGFTTVSGGQKAKDATIAMMMGVSPSVVAKMRRDQKGVLARGQTSDDFQAQTDEIDRISNSNLSAAEKERRIRKLQSSGGGKGSWGMLQADLKDAGMSGIDPNSKDGKTTYKDEIIRAGEAAAAGKKGIEGLRARQEGRMAKYQELEAQKAGATNKQPGDVSIEFGPGAKQFFKLLQDGKVTEAAKAAAGAGGDSLNNQDIVTPPYSANGGSSVPGVNYVGQ